MSISHTLTHYEIADTPISGLKKILRKVASDHRGSFVRLYCSDELAAAGWCQPVVQVNHSVTTERGTVRGLHFQLPPYAEMKLVSCIRGEVWDVALDLRHGSPTFLRWHAEHLTPENGVSLLIPEGVAHGFQSLAEQSELIYCHSAVYRAVAEGGYRFDDPTIGISWPLPPRNLSVRDLSLPMIAPGFKGVGESS